MTPADLDAAAAVVLSWLLTYAIHSTILLAVAAVAAWRFADQHAWLDLIWKTALIATTGDGHPAPRPHRIAAWRTLDDAERDDGDWDALPRLSMKRSRPPRRLSSARRRRRLSIAPQRAIGQFLRPKPDSRCGHRWFARGRRSPQWRG